MVSIPSASHTDTRDRRASRIDTLSFPNTPPARTRPATHTCSPHAASSTRGGRERSGTGRWALTSQPGTSQPPAFRVAPRVCAGDGRRGAGTGRGGSGDDVPSVPPWHSGTQGRQPGTPVANAGTHGCSRGALGHTTLVERETRGGAGGGSSITVKSPEPLRRGGGAAALSARLRMRLTPGITPCACSTPAECLTLDDAR